MVYLSYTYLNLRITEIQNPYKFDECVHCCGTMNSPQHPGLPPVELAIYSPLFSRFHFFFHVKLFYIRNKIPAAKPRLPSVPFLIRSPINGADVVEFKKLKLAKQKILNKIVSKAGMIQAGQRCAITGITTLIPEYYIEGITTLLQEYYLKGITTPPSCPHCYS